MTEKAAVMTEKAASAATRIHHLEDAGVTTGQPIQQANNSLRSGHG